MQIAALRNQLCVLVLWENQGQKQRVTPAAQRLPSFSTSYLILVFVMTVLFGLILYVFMCREWTWADYSWACVNIYMCRPVVNTGYFCQYLPHLVCLRWSLTELGTHQLARVSGQHGPRDLPVSACPNAGMTDGSIAMAPTYSRMLGIYKL